MFSRHVMMNRTRADIRVTAVVGFAASANGNGVAYAALRPARDAQSLVRVGFRLVIPTTSTGAPAPSGPDAPGARHPEPVEGRPRPALHGRDVAYAALTALATELLRRGIGAVVLQTDNAELVADLTERRAVPAALTVPYVKLRCTLNRFREASITCVEDRATRDLTARARAEVCLNVAA